MNIRPFAGAPVGVALALLLSVPALAAERDKDPTTQRIDRIEKEIRQVHNILLQARLTDQPVAVRVVTDPDPVVQTVQGKLDDIEQTVRNINGQIDSLTHQLEQARKDTVDARAENKALADRLDAMEKRFAALEAHLTAPEPAPVAPATAPAAGPAAAPAPDAAPAAAATAPAAPDTDAAFRAAKQLLLEGRYGDSSIAFQTFVEQYGDSPQGPEARYWLGETLYLQNSYSDAATAYIGSIRGWPKTAWAPNAVVKLARSLIALNKPADACKALDAFKKHYPDAKAAIKTKADDARAAAQCPVK